jgi:1-acyl-sn-glycerol-3-phosphate acyltransferase
MRWRAPAARHEHRMSRDFARLDAARPGTSNFAGLARYSAQMSDLAPMREQVYSDPRPKEYFDRFHARARTREPDWVYDLVRVITSLYAYTFLRARAISSENAPGSGAVILAPNHFSFMDHFLMGCFVRRKVRFMAKSQLFKKPMQFIYTHGGVFPVRRGARDEETFITAETILNRGGAVTMYCEGGRSRTGKVSEQAKRGIGRLALETGAPVVPIAIFGSSRVRNWKRLQFPKVTVQYGEAISWEKVENPTREQQQAVADEILVEIRRLYAGLQEHGRKGILRRVRDERRPPKGAAVA